MTDDQTERGASPATRQAPGRAWRLLAGFLVASAAVHAGLVAFVPEFERRSDPPPVVLEVTLVEPRPLPVTPPEPEPPSPPPVRRRPAPPPEVPVDRDAGARHKAAPVAEPKQPRPAPKAEQSAAVVSLPAPQAPTEPAFPVSPRQPAASPAPRPQTDQTVTATPAPPTFNAAYLRNPAPRYPLAARRAGEQGTVTLRVLVLPDGQPGRVELERSSGSTHLDNAAVEAVKGWRFTPARRGSDAVEGWVVVPIVFRLEG